MEPSQLLEHLIDLAGEAGIEVRATGAADAGIASGVCRVRDAVWVVLSAADPADEQIAVLARALVAHASEFLESRYLPPAVRARLEACGGAA